MLPQDGTGLLSCADHFSQRCKNHYPFHFLGCGLIISSGILVSYHDCFYMFLTSFCLLLH